GRSRPLRSAWALAAALVVLGPLDRALADPTGARPLERIYAAGARLWIYSEPKRSSHPIGYARAGTSLELGDARRIAGPGCGFGYFAVKPFGYVCADSHATFDGSSLAVQRMQRLVPAAAAFPYSYA